MVSSRSRRRAGRPPQPARTAWIDLTVDVVEPAFSVIALLTTLRLPHHRLAFRLTHRFSRPLDGGLGHGNLLEDFFGFDSAAVIGLELRYGVAPGAQVGIYRNNTKNIQIFGQYNILWQGNPPGIGLDAFVSVEGNGNFRKEYSPALGVVLSQRIGNRAAVYVEPIWVGNTNKRGLLHPAPLPRSEHDNTLMAGLGTRLRVRDTTYVVAEYVPRPERFRPGKQSHRSVGLEIASRWTHLPAERLELAGCHAGAARAGRKHDRLVHRIQYRPQILLSGRPDSWVGLVEGEASMNTWSKRVRGRFCEPSGWRSRRYLPPARAHQVHPPESNCVS